MDRPELREKISKILWAGIDLQEELDQILALIPDSLTPEVVDGMVQEAKLLGAKEGRERLEKLYLELTKRMDTMPMMHGDYQLDPILAQDLMNFRQALKSKEKVNGTNYEHR